MPWPWYCEYGPFVVDWCVPCSMVPSSAFWTAVNCCSKEGKILSWTFVGALASAWPAPTSQRFCKMMCKKYLRNRSCLVCINSSLLIRAHCLGFLRAACAKRTHPRLEKSCVLILLYLLKRVFIFTNVGARGDRWCTLILVLYLIF